MANTAGYTQRNKQKIIRYFYWLPVKRDYNRHHQSTNQSCIEQ